MSEWFLINSLAFIGTPAGLLDGWIAYMKQGEKSAVRSRLGFLALFLGSVSVLALIVYLFAPHAAPAGDIKARILMRLGIYSGLAGAAIAFSSKRRLIIPAFFAGIGAVMLWFGLTTL